MAEISLRELVRVLMEHPDYYQRWHRDVSPGQALYISFGGAEPESPLESETYDAVDGSVVVVDRDSAGVVWGLEIT